MSAGRGPGRGWLIATAAVAVLGTVALIWFAVGRTVVPPAEEPAPPPAQPVAERPDCPAPGTAAAPAGAALAGVRLPCLGADQGEIDLGAALAGAPAVLNFWSPSCAPCREELPVFDAYARAHPEVTVVGVHQAASAARGAALLRDAGIALPSYHDGADVAGPALGLPRVQPVTVVLDAGGAVRAVLPRVFTDPGELAAAVAGALG